LKNSKLIISVASDGDDADPLMDALAVAEVRLIEFSAKHHGMRLDRVLVELVPEFSRSYLQQLIELGAVTIAGQRVQKPAQKVRAFDNGSIELKPTPQSQAFKAEAISLEIVHSDEHLLVINKPAGLVVHPAPGNWSGTLMNALLGFDPRAFDLPRAGIVHRLDKDTSGLMVVARSRPVMDELVRKIAAHQVKRQYLALAHGRWTGESKREIDMPVGRDPVNRLRMAVVDLASQAGKPARTDVELVANGETGCLVKCNLHTGRTHQIRVHMATIGHPLVADLVYGGALALSMNRQALHAFRLGFVHPVTGQPLSFEVGLPSDFSEALNQWSLQYNTALI
jgi:23S rRNA pseudouridine1911/1915/1917 synthase